MTIRPARPEDQDAVVALVPRLASTGTPPGRDPTQVAATDLLTIGPLVASRPPGTEVLVAEADGHVVGFVHLTTVTDYYTQDRIGHVSDLVVAEGTEGRGVGRALMAAGEAWARGLGYPMVQLFVVVGNGSARALYERLGYAAEWLKYVKSVAPAVAPTANPADDPEAARPPARPIGWWLKRADALLTERVDEAQRACGLTRLEWQALNAVRGGEDVAAALRPFCNADKASEVLAGLETRGLTATAGARHTLTREGDALYDRALSAQQGVREQSMAGIAPGEYAATVAVLERLVQNLERTVGDTPGSDETGGP